MSHLENIDRSTLGLRLRKARLSSGMTQSQVASKLSVSRPTLVAIENGKRRLRLDELQSFAVCYMTSVNRLLAGDTVHLDLCTRFRRGTSRPESTVQAILLLNKLASAMVELENLLGVRVNPTIVPEFPIVRGAIDRQAEEAALTLRHRIGIGLSPINDVVSLIEIELGIRVFIRDISSSISGLFGYDQTVGACILLNANHPRERQSMTACHEIGHFLSSRLFGDIVYFREDDDAGEEERFANSFSYAFLMPSVAVRQRFRELVEVNRKFTPRHLVFMASIFHVSLEAICRRLERLELLPNGTFESLRDRGFTQEIAHRGLKGPLSGKPTRHTSFRLTHLVTSALRRGLLSEGQVSRMLDLDRVDVRKMVDDVWGAEEDEIAIPLD